MKKLFYYFLIATLAFNFVGCSDKDKDLDDVIDNNGNEWWEDYKDFEQIVIDNCTYTIHKNGQAELDFGYNTFNTEDDINAPKDAAKGDFVVPQTITYETKTYTVTRVDFGAFALCHDLTSLTFPDKIEYIGQGGAI